MNDDQHYKSLHERISYVVGIAAIPAISVMVFTRTQLGFRQINIFRQLVVTVFLLVFSSSSRLSINIPFVPSYQGSVSPVLGFVVAMLAAGWWQKKIYKKNLAEGNFWHSYSMGISRLNKMFPFPYRWAEQFIEPALMMFVGMFIAYNMSVLLGTWLLLAGIGMSV